MKNRNKKETKQNILFTTLVFLVKAYLKPVFFLKKLTIYYMKHSSSICLLNSIEFKL